MYLEEQLPSDYVPYNTLVVCGNTFINTEMPVEVDGHPPFVIGVGPYPRVWLNASIGKPVRSWATVVKDNVSRSSGVIVKRSKSGAVQIFAAGTKVLSVKPTGPDTAEVVALDLRPLGLNIHGNRSSLWVAANQLSGNTISNCRSGVAIGG